MKKIIRMDPRLSRSMPLLLPPAHIPPVTYRMISPRWPERRSYTPRHFYVGGVRTKLIGANSYPNHSRSPQRLILCGGGGRWSGKVIRSSSTAELSRSGVYCSSEDLRDQGRRLSASRRAASCEDVYVRGTHTPGWDSRFSESGVSLNDSRGTDLASLVGMEPEDVDVDGVSQCSFGSSSAFHEITCDSELDRISDTVSVPGSSCGGQDRTLDVVHEGGGDEGGGGGRDGRSHHRKTRHDSGSREKFLSELNAAASTTSVSCGSGSGRSSPSWDDRSQRKEFDHSTPTKRGSPAQLSVFPAGDEEDLHFPPIHSSKVSSASSPSLYLPIPISPVLSQRLKEGKREKKSPPSSPGGTDNTGSRRESLRKSRQEFFSSLQPDGPNPNKLEAEQTAGESVQSWLTTGHTQRHRGTNDESPTESQQQSLEDQLSLRSSPTSSPRRLSVKERVAKLEQGPILKAADNSDGKGANALQVESSSINDNQVAEGKSSSDHKQEHINEARRLRDDNKEKGDEIAEDAERLSSPSLSPRLQVEERCSRENRGTENPGLATSEGGGALFAPSSHQTDPSIQTASSQHVERARQTNTEEDARGGGEGQVSPSSPQFQKLSDSATDFLHPDSGSNEADKINAGSIFEAQTSKTSGECSRDADGAVDTTTNSSLTSARHVTSALTEDILTGVTSAVTDSVVNTEEITDSDKSIFPGVIDSADDYNVNTVTHSITSASDRRELNSIADRETESDSNYSSEDRSDNKGSNSRPSDRVFTADYSRNVNTSWLSGVEEGEKKRLEGVAYEKEAARRDTKGEKKEEDEWVSRNQNAEQTQHAVDTLTPYYSSTSPLSRQDDTVSCDAASTTHTPQDLCSNNTATLTHTPPAFSTTAVTTAPTRSSSDTEYTINTGEQIRQNETEDGVVVQAHDSGAESNTDPSHTTAFSSQHINNTSAEMMMDGRSSSKYYYGPEATTVQFVDRSEEVLPDCCTVTKEEVGCRRNTTTRHVRRTTTVEETVTTHRTVRHTDAASVLDPHSGRSNSGKGEAAAFNPTPSSATLLQERESRSTQNGFGSFHDHAPQNGHAAVSGVSSSESTLKSELLGSSSSSPRVSDFVTEDRTVRTTRTVREEDSEKEETTTTTNTKSTDAVQFTPASLYPTAAGRQQQVGLVITGGKAGREKEVEGGGYNNNATTTASLVTATAETHKDQSFTPVDSLTTSRSSTTTTTTHQQPEEVENTEMMAGKGRGWPRQQQTTNNNASFNLLDSLEEQLSLLSSPEDVSFSDGARYHSSRSGGAFGGYRDHAEASLPHQQRQQYHSESNNKTDSVQGTGSVSITLDKSYHHASTFPYSAFHEGSGVSDYNNADYLISHGSSTPRDEASRLRHARVSQESTAWVDGGGKTFEDRKGEKSGQRASGLAWRAPASLSSSSSEWDDSDGNYSSISTTDSHGQHESDFPTSEGPEDYDNVNSFHDFVSGLHGQSTSDQPSVDVVLGAPDHHRSSSSLLRNSFIQETILEADDESETADEADTTGNSTLSNFRSSLHFSVPPPTSQSTPRMQYVSPVPEIKLWSTDQHLSDLSASADGDMTLSLDPALSPVRSGHQQHSLLQELSDRLSSVSGGGADGDLSQDLSFTLQDSRLHYDPEMSDTSRHSACCSPAPSDVSEASSMFSSSATAEVRKQAEMGTSFKFAELTPVTHKVSRRNLTSAFDNTAMTKIKTKSLSSSSSTSSKSRKSEWVHEKILLFQRLLNDLEWQSRSSEQKLLDDMVALETGHRGGESTGVDNMDEGFSEKQRTEGLCEDLYREFTRDYQEKRQSHVCPFVEDHLPVFRFRRFLRRKHNSRLKGSNYRRTFRLRHRLDKLAEMESLEKQSSDGKSVSDSNLPLSPPYHLHTPTSKLHLSPRLRDRLVSDVFTADDVDVKKSFSSDSAYSTLSGGTSRNISELDSTARSLGDVSSIATDVSMDDGTDKLRCLSDVFDQLDVCEGQIDNALLDRLSTGHYKADTL